MLHFWLQRYHARIRTLGSSLVFWSLQYAAHSSCKHQRYVTEMSHIHLVRRRPTISIKFAMILCDWYANIFWRDPPLIRKSLRAACLLSCRVVRFKYLMLLLHIYESACERLTYLELLRITCMLHDREWGDCAAAVDAVAFSWRSKRFQIRRAFASRFVKCVISWCDKLWAILGINLAALCRHYSSSSTPIALILLRPRIQRIINNRKNIRIREEL